MSEFRFSPKFPNVDVDRVVDVLHQQYEKEDVFGMTFLDLYRQSLDKTNSGINPFQAINKVRRCFNLVRMFERSKGVPGDIAEAGVFRGSTARLVADAALLGGYDMSGRKMVLFDSFEGLPESGFEDLQPQELPEGEGSDPFYRSTPRRFSNTSVDAVSGVFTDVDWVELQKGWIPDGFKGHEDRRFSFVHIDVDLYQSTLDCLQYFVPRMNPGGIIVCDDYLSLRFPGARTAWDLYCRETHTKFITLDNYQSVIFA